MNRPDDWQHDHEVGALASTGWPATHDSTRVDDVRIAAVRPLISPALLHDELPMPEAAQALVESTRAQIAAILAGVDPRLIVVAGPCSIHDHGQAIEYGQRLRTLAPGLRIDVTPIDRRRNLELLESGEQDLAVGVRFEAATGLRLTDANGVRDDLPPITTFLNRLLALTIELQGVLFTAFEQLLAARVEGAIAAGVYDAGLETLVAESFAVTGRQVIHTHPRTGAETRLLTIRQRQRNRPLTLANALARADEPGGRLLVNARSGRAAVQVPAASVMLDDGEIERRVRLVRPMEAASLPVKALGETQWEEADPDGFARAWEAELGAVPVFTDSTLHIVNGLLLPIWKRLPQDSTRVYRLRTDDGERIVGRRVSPAWVAGVLAATDAAPAIAAEDAFAALLAGTVVLTLAEGLALRRVRVMNAHRIELIGFGEAMRERLRADGLFSEIISWKLRMFVPTGAEGPAVLARLLDRWPVARVSERSGG